VSSAFPGHAGRSEPLLGWRLVARIGAQGTKVSELSPPTGTPVPDVGPAPAAEAPGLDPAFAETPMVEVANVSVWFGPKVALSELSCSFGPGLTGLLGPNGAGKTTLMRSITGLIGVNGGGVRVGGRDPRSDRKVQRLVALVPEDEAVPEPLTARQFVHYTADLHRVPDREAPERSLAAVGLLDVADRRLGGFSKGMRQRAKVAAALVSDPAVLVLDEPLNGADPVQRVALIALFKELGRQGRTVIVSSHILHEVERLADRVIVLLRGRLAAAGGHRAIRDAMADRPRRVVVRTASARRLAAALLGVEAVAGVTLDGDDITVSTTRAGELASALPRLARDTDARLVEVRPIDDSLESMFRELVR
jgi:ABC-2 type transport system ATP-binding protein